MKLYHCVVLIFVCAEAVLKGRKKCNSYKSVTLHLCNYYTFNCVDMGVFFA